MSFKKLKKLVITLFVLCLLFGGVLVGFTAYTVLNKVNQNEMTLTDEELGIKTDTAIEGTKDEIVNIALFGVDRRSKNERGRSDSIMVATINTKTNSVKLTSLMRDMLVDVRGKNDKLNHSYSYGGPELAIKTINENFDLNIRNYVSVDFFGLPKIIDSVGGIPIDIKEKEIKYMNQTITEVNNLEKRPPEQDYILSDGLQTVNGRQALAYGRIRYVGNGDYERTERQRIILEAVLNKVKSLNASDSIGVVSEGLDYVETSLSNKEIFSLATKVMSMGSDFNVQQYRIPVDGTFDSGSYNGMSVLKPNFEENINLLHTFIQE